MPNAIRYFDMLALSVKGKTQQVGADFHAVVQESCEGVKELVVE